MMIRQFVQVMKKYRKNSFKKKIDNFFSIIDFLRQLIIAAFSFMLIRLNIIFNNIEFIILIDDLNLYRFKNFKTFEILTMTRRDENSQINTNLKTLQLLNYGFFKFRYIFNQLRIYVLSKNTFDKKIYRSSKMFF